MSPTNSIREILSKKREFHESELEKNNKEIELIDKLLLELSLIETGQAVYAEHAAEKALQVELKVEPIVIAAVEELDIDSITKLSDRHRFILKYTKTLGGCDSKHLVEKMLETNSGFKCAKHDIHSDLWSLKKSGLLIMKRRGYYVIGNAVPAVKPVQSVSFQTDEPIGKYTARELDVLNVFKTYNKLERKDLKRILVDEIKLFKTDVSVDMYIRRLLDKKAINKTGYGTYEIIKCEPPVIEAPKHDSKFSKFNMTPFIKSVYDFAEKTEIFEKKDLCDKFTGDRNELYKALNVLVDRGIIAQEEKGIYTFNSNHGCVIMLVDESGRIPASIKRQEIIDFVKTKVPCAILPEIQHEFIKGKSYYGEVGLNDVLAQLVEADSLRKVDVVDMPGVAGYVIYAPITEAPKNNDEPTMFNKNQIYEYICKNKPFVSIEQVAQTFIEKEKMTNRAVENAVKDLFKEKLIVSKVEGIYEKAENENGIRSTKNLIFTSDDVLKYIKMRRMVTMKELDRMFVQSGYLKYATLYAKVQKMNVDKEIVRLEKGKYAIKGWND